MKRILTVFAVMACLLMVSLVSALDIWSSIYRAFALMQPFALTHTGEISYPGDTFEHPFMLKNTGAIALPDLDSSDGSVTRLYKTYRMTDQATNKVKEDYEEVNTTIAVNGTVPYTITLSIDAGTPSGQYSAIAVLFKITQTWSRATNTWSTGDAVILDKQGVVFDVQTPTPPPTPSVSQILEKIAAVFQQILCFIKQLFGQTC